MSWPMYMSTRSWSDVCRCVSVWKMVRTVVVIVECSVVLFFIGKSKYAGFNPSMETVSCLPFMVSVKYLGYLSTTWSGQK